MMLFDQFANPPEHWLKQQEDEMRRREQHRIEYFTNLAEMDQSDPSQKKSKKSKKPADANQPINVRTTRRTTTTRRPVTTRRTTTRRPVNRMVQNRPNQNNGMFNSFGQLNRARPMGAQKATQKPNMPPRVKPTQPTRQQPVRKAQPLQNIRTTRKPMTQVFL